LKQIQSSPISEKTSVHQLLSRDGAFVAFFCDQANSRSLASEGVGKQVDIQENRSGTVRMHRRFLRQAKLLAMKCE